jgi:cysteinyl-tRNA synthetase
VAIRILDSQTGQKRDFVPVREGHVGIYFCGMTVQDRPHVGHMRSAIVGDVIRRHFERRGYDVAFVYNFTDVDDRIIEKANAEGVEPRVVADRNIAAYFEVADALGVRRATIHPRATDHIDGIIGMIERLVEGGHAYAAGGDVYFRVSKFPGYGKLSGRKTDDLRAGARIAVGEHKDDPLDFTLWKGAKPGEPAWESPWGPGRPGWHIECSVMSTMYLGETFDIHGGGLDLIFPHHENEIAQSEAATGRPFANYWVHNGLVNLSGEKMSKSTKHFFLARDAIAEFPPDVVRYYLLSTHYRSPIEFSEERLREVEIAHGRIAKALAAADELRPRLKSEPSLGDGELRAETEGLGRAFLEAMDDDFNTAKAIGHLFELARAVNRSVDEAASDPTAPSRAVAAADRLRELSAVLGLTWKERAVEATVPDEVRRLLDEREKARRERDWALADRLRGEIAARGFTIEDRPDGSRLVPIT